MTTATRESLFIKKLDPNELFEKEATIARMPDDDRKWPEVVLSELHKQLPFMSGMDVSLNFTRIQPEAGYGFGYAMVRGKKHIIPGPTKSEDQMVKIPIVVADRHLEPFHVFHFEGKTLPLTQARFEEALLNPQVFAGPTKTPKTQKSLIDQLYPPYQQRQGFGRVVDGSGMSGSSMGINKTAEAPANQAPPPRKSFGQAIKDDLNPLHAGSMTHTPAMTLGGTAAGAGIGKLLGGNRGAFIGSGIGFGVGALKGIYNDHKAQQGNIDRMKDRMMNKQAQAPAMVQNPMDTLSPGQLKRLATLKQYQGIDKAKAQLSSRDKTKETVDNAIFAGAAGGLAQGGLTAMGARKASTPLTAKALGKSGLRGIATGVGISLLGKGYQSAKAKMREKDRQKEQYAQYLNTQQQQ